ncbi:response regulator [Cryomorphaceae bacterium]|nr:response regulator [Cryomorphaceae bacterium]
MIFVIDDDLGFQMVFKRQFERLEWNEPVETFQYAHQALERLCAEEHKCDKMPTRIFLDLEMPGMNGWAFLEEFRKLPCDCREDIELFILSSNKDLKSIDRAGEIKEVKDYLVKPLRMDTLHRILNNGYTAQSPSLF